MQSLATLVLGPSRILIGCKAGLGVGRQVGAAGSAALAGVEGIACREDASADEIRLAIEAAVERVDTGAGVIVFTDMFGDTASNVCVRIAESRPGLEVLAGVNMPMLVKLTTERGQKRSVAELADFLREYGRSHIVHAEVRRTRRREAGA